MYRDQIRSTFDRQAPAYDQQCAKMAPLRECLQLLLGPVFGALPGSARILCVGAGTGVEIEHLAGLHPGWRFTAVDPSAGMLEACRRRARAGGFGSRCEFHEGYLESLPPAEPFDAATSLLVSQFILDRPARAAYFAGIAQRLRPGALLASADLAADLAQPGQRQLLEAWFRTMAAAELTPEALQRMREAYDRDVAVIPPAEVEAIIAAGGFEAPVRFFQAGLIHAWFAPRRAAG